jgi:hypothetical protein
MKMKKLLSTAAIVAALSTPAFADVTIGGDFEWSHQNNDSAKSTAVDADLNIKTSTTTDTGLTFGADFNLNQDGNDDGGNSLTVSNDMFALDLGDTNSALDAIDDATDWGYVLTNGSPSVDHAAILTLTPLTGLKVNVSMATGDDYGTTADEGYAYSASYTVGPVTLGGGKMVNDDDTEATIMNISGSIADLGLAAEQYTDTTAAGVDTDTTTMSATYTIDATTFAVESMKAESASVVSSDEMTYGIHHTVAPGLVAFVEMTDDEKTASEKTTAIGLALKF